MKFSYASQNAAEVKDKIAESLLGRELGQMVSLELADNELTVTISKLGTSKLVFSIEKAKDGLVFALAKEKLAFAHRAFRGEVEDKLCRVIEKTGGRILG